MQRSVFSVAIAKRFIQPIQFFGMFASSSGNWKVTNSRTSSVSLPVSKKRKMSSIFQKPVIMESTEADRKTFVGKVIHLPNPVKSQNDKKEYRVLQLPNGMRVLLISDRNKMVDSEEDERMAAAALCVNVGSFSDPSDLSGLANFLEHMVFRGSNKYPENAFGELLETYGGFPNASTDYETTKFGFEIPQRFFHEALEIFAEFFASPLLLPESMNREKEVFYSDLDSQYTPDSARKQILLDSLAKSGHPIAKSITLDLPDDPEGVKLNQRLRLFWKENYTADRMTLVLQSKHDLNQLEEWAASIFQGIPSNNSQPATPPCFKELGFPFDTPHFRQVVKVLPVKHENEVCLSWALPSQLENYRIKPLWYLSWLIGHGGKGSLLAYLRKKVWALRLCNNDDDHNSTYALFRIHICLTERGMAEVEQVINAVFQYIQMLKGQGPDERMWREIQSIEDLRFRYTEDSPPAENVWSLSENMHKHSPIEYITGDALFFDYNPEVISECLNALRMDNVNIMISQDFEISAFYDQLEPCFQTRYCVQEIPEDWKQIWSRGLEGESPFAVPNPNPFLASDFSLLEPSPAGFSLPVKVDGKDDGFSLWYRQDSKLPKAKLDFYLVTRVDCAQDAVLLELLAKMLEHQLIMERVYDALYQLKLVIRHYASGLFIKVSGFNHKLHFLIGAIVEQLAKFEQEAVVEVFEAIREQEEKTCRNSLLKLKRPYITLFEWDDQILDFSHWPVLDKLEAVKNLTLNDLTVFSKKLKETCHLECRVQGNYSKEQALEVARSFKKTMQPNDPLTPIRIRQVPFGNKWCRLA